MQFKILGALVQFKILGAFVELKLLGAFASGLGFNPFESCSSQRRLLKFMFPSHWSIINE